MPIDAAEVRRIADLAHLELDDRDVERYRERLKEILDWVAMIEEVADPAEPVAPHAVAAGAEPRPDRPAPALAQSEAVGNAPDTAAGFFRLPRVLDRTGGE